MLKKCFSFLVVSALVGIFYLKPSLILPCCFSAMALLVFCIYKSSKLEEEKKQEEITKQKNIVWYYDMEKKHTVILR